LGVLSARESGIDAAKGDAVDENGQTFIFRLDNRGRINGPIIPMSHMERAAAKKPLGSILVKPVGPDCNQACSYCFYRGKSSVFPESSARRMKKEILGEMINQALAQCGEVISFAWQGGEPTLAGLEFFQTAVDLQRGNRRGKTVRNAFQTNGLLIDQKWADFLRDNGFLVGLSLDGPKHVHDRYRKLPGGPGSWEKAVDKARLLIDNGVEVNVLTVVNDYSVRFPEEIYEFHKNLGFTYMQFIPCFDEGLLRLDNKRTFSPSPDAYGEFLVKIFDLWRSDFVNGLPSVFIRYFDSVFYSYVDLEPPDCNLRRECGDYIVVEHNGDVFPCDFYVEPRLRLGNIMSANMIDLLNSGPQRSFGEMKSVLPGTCQGCPWLSHCWGGCPKERQLNSKDRQVSLFCTSYKRFFEHADAHLRRLASFWKQMQSQRC
jgi:uncharacterized protein